MNLSLIISAKRFLLIILTFAIQSCNFDQVNEYYSDYHTATSENLFNKGWIPDDIVSESMNEIHLHTNLDINSCFFTFKLSEQDLNRITQSISRVEREIKPPLRVNISRKDINAIKSLDKYVHTNSVNNDTVFLSLDYKTKKIYGWRY